MIYRNYVLVLLLAALLLPSQAGAQGPDGSTTSPLRMRTGPGVEYRVVTVLPAGTGLIFEAAAADGFWLLAHTIDGAFRGWVSSPYVTFSEGFRTEQLPISAEIIGAAPASAAMPVSLRPAEGDVLAMTTGSLHVRRGPAGYYGLVGQIFKDTQVWVEARSGMEWLLVRTPDGSVRGWVVAEFVAFESPDILFTLRTTSEVVDASESEIMQRLRQTPVVAQATPTARAIFERGVARGNHPDRFSKVGDCQNVTEFFLSMFDGGEYDLGQYDHLQAAIDHFAGSWSRESQAVESGFNVMAVNDPIWSNPAYCRPGETPMACEYRLWQPSFVIISLEIWYGLPEEYEVYLRQVLDYWIGQDVVPILATKPSNQEGDWSINETVARLAWEYDIPLWNFLMAAQPLPNQGLVDSFHLSYAGCRFDDPQAMLHGWPWRNLTALQSLDAVWRGVSE